MLQQIKQCSDAQRDQLSREVTILKAMAMKDKTSISVPRQGFSRPKFFFWWLCRPSMNLLQQFQVELDSIAFLKNGTILGIIPWYY